MDDGFNSFKVDIQLKIKADDLFQLIQLAFVPVYGKRFLSHLVLHFSPPQEFCNNR